MILTTITTITVNKNNNNINNSKDSSMISDNDHHSKHRISLFAKQTPSITAV